MISGKITESQIDANEVYNKSARIESKDLFQYGMETNIGNAFVYGDLAAVDTVTYPEIVGEYMYVKKIKERYTRHTKRVKKGKAWRTKVYWTWDRIGSESLKCKEISFCGATFNADKIGIPGTSYIDTIKESSRIRYKYYGTGTKFTGTIFADLRNQTIPDNTKFYNGKTIEETAEQLESGGGTIIFWTFWILLTCGCVFGFCYMDNKWLE